MKESVYIFDVDGVINTLTVHDADKRVLELMARLLNRGNYIAINTGRGYPWVRDTVITPIRKLVEVDKIDNIFVAAEMGGVTVEFVEGGEKDSNSAFSLTKEQIDTVKQVFQKHQGKSLRWYEGKVSMATIDKPADQDVAVFAQEAGPVVAELKDLFRDGHIKVGLTADAIDVTTKEAGKWAGAQLIYDWLQRTPAVSARHFVCFGDNASDYDMAHFFASQGHDVDFVFTGKELGAVEPDSNVTVIKPKHLYSQGTYEFLEKHLGGENDEQ